LLTTLEATATWWRPESPAASPDAASRYSGSRVAFGALVAFTGFLVLSPQVWFPFLKSLRIAFVAAGIAILAHLLDRAVHRRPVDRLHPEIAIAVALVGWSVLTIPLSYWPGGSVTELTDHFLKAVAFFWLLGTVITTGDRLRMFMWLLVLCSVPLSFTAVQNYQSGVFLRTPEMSAARIAGYNPGGSGLADNPNDLALMLNLLIPFAAALMVSARRIVLRAVAACALLLSVAAVIVTFSRAGFLSLVATGVISLLVVARRQPLTALAIALVLFVSVPLVLPHGYLARVATITNIESDRTGSAQGRWNDLGVAVDIVAKNPATGVGPGQNVLALNRERGPTWRLVHNVYLQYAVDLGLPGLMLFMWLFVAVFQAVNRVRRRARKDRDPALRELGCYAGAVQVALLAFAVTGFFAPVAYQFYFYCVAGLALAIKNVCRTAATASA
jgi:probable O-glycosylation ligase (exosortase A-associated)